MNIISFLCIVISISCAYLGFYIIKIDYKNSLNRLFFLICLCLFFFSLSGSFVFSAESKEKAFFLYKVTLLFFAPFHALNLHFYFELTRKKVKDWIKIIIYLPAIVVIFTTITSTSIYSDCFMQNGSWKFKTSPDTFGFIFYTIYTISYILIYFSILYNWGKKTKLRKEKKQYKIILIGFGISVSTGIIIDLILPSFQFYKLPNIGPGAFLFYVFCVWYSLVKYKFLVFQPSIIADEIISNIQEMVILLDPSLKIITVNKKCLELLSCDPEDIKDKLFCELILKNKYCTDELNRLIHEEKESYAKRIHYKSKPDDILTESYLSNVKDDFGDIIGILIISRENKSIKEFLRRYKITDHQFEIIELCISGLSNRAIGEKLGLAKRTVDAHLFSIYYKLGINNKIELMNLAIEHNLISKDRISA